MSQVHTQTTHRRVNQMKRLSTMLASLALATTITWAKDLVNCDAASKTGLQGYDPVAFFTDARATKGSPLITGEHKGVTYLFASEEHKAVFAKDPEKYLPAYGGYCAYGVSINKLFPVEIDTWEIVDGRLVLQYNQDIRHKFAQDQAANFSKAEANWPKLVERKGK
jgi:YHS domain-containing protein